MNINSQRFVSVTGISIVLTCGSAWDVFSENSLSSSKQAAVITSAAKQCPRDLSSLQPKMEKALQFIKSASFRNTILTSLHASIPEAIVRADGLAQQIAFLKQEIVSQEQERAHAEEVARDVLKDPSQPLTPCRHGKEGAYCHAMDQYLASIAANLANQSFLNALQCYQQEGVR